MTRDLRIGALALVLVSGCGPGAAAPDGGGPPDAFAMLDASYAPDTGPAPCRVDADCDDEMFCTGIETCSPGAPGADALGCVASEPCAGSVCDEATDTCSACATDDDGDDDGAVAAICGGPDCDDGDPAISPAATETCNEVDDDCDGAIDDVDAASLPGWLADADGDGYGAGELVAQCDPPSPGAVTRGGDCDDADPLRSPGRIEMPDDGVDNDCDGTVDRARTLVGSITSLGGAVGTGSRRVLGARIEGFARACGTSGRCVVGAVLP